MAGDPLLEAAAAVNTRLSGDGALTGLAPGGVWEGKEGAGIEEYPAVIYSLLPMSTDYTLRGPYRHRLSLVTVVLDKGEAVDAAAAVAARVYELLQDADDGALPMTNYDVLYCRRTLQNKAMPLLEGETYQQLMDSYDLQVRPA